MATGTNPCKPTYPNGWFSWAPYSASEWLGNGNPYINKLEITWTVSALDFSFSVPLGADISASGSTATYDSGNEPDWYVGLEESSGAVEGYDYSTITGVTNDVQGYITAEPDTPAGGGATSDGWGGDAWQYQSGDPPTVDVD
jgi:hypothetical protein